MGKKRRTKKIRGTRSSAAAAKNEKSLYIPVGESAAVQSNDAEQKRKRVEVERNALASWRRKVLLSLSLSLSLLLSRPSHLSAAPPRRLLSSTREIKIRSLPLTAARTTGSRYFQPDLDDRCFVHICTYVWRSLTPIAGPCHRTFYKINGYHLPCRERTLFRDDPSNTRRTWVTWLLFVAFLFLCFISRWNKTLKRMLFPLQWRVWLTWSL